MKHSRKKLRLLLRGHTTTPDHTTTQTRRYDRPIVRVVDLDTSVVSMICLLRPKEIIHKKVRKVRLMTIIDSRCRETKPLFLDPFLKVNWKKINEINCLVTFISSIRPKVDYNNFQEEGCNKEIVSSITVWLVWNFFLLYNIVTQKQKDGFNHYQPDSSLYRENQKVTRD